MSATPNVDRRVEAFLSDGPTIAPDHLLGQSLRAAAAERQLRRPWWPQALDRGARRDAALVLAGTGAVLGLAGLILWRGGLIPPVPSPSGEPGSFGPPTPSPSASPRSDHSSTAPTTNPEPTPAIYASESLGFSVDYSNLTQAPIVGWGAVSDAVVFPARYVGADVYEYAFMVSAGDPERGVWLVGDGARVRASTLGALETAFREHVPGASEATAVAVDGEPAHLLLVPQVGGTLGAITTPGAASIPVVLVVHASRPYVISWRTGLIPGQTDRQARMLAFLERFKFLEPGQPAQ